MQDPFYMISPSLLPPRSCTSMLAYFPSSQIMVHYLESSFLVSFWGAVCQLCLPCSVQPSIPHTQQASPHREVLSRSGLGQSKSFRAQWHACPCCVRPDLGLGMGDTEPCQELLFLAPAGLAQWQWHVRGQDLCSFSRDSGSSCSCGVAPKPSTHTSLQRGPIFYLPAMQRLRSLDAASLPATACRSISEKLKNCS